jgi:hypothetical protein
MSNLNARVCENRTRPVFCPSILTMTGTCVAVLASQDNCKGLATILNERLVSYVRVFTAGAHRSLYHDLLWLHPKNI